VKPSSLTAAMLLAVCYSLTDWLLENLHSARAGGGLRFFFFGVGIIMSWIQDPSSYILSRRLCRVSRPISRCHYPKRNQAHRSYESGDFFALHRISAKAMCRVPFVAGIARDARGG
jgi:hypothetical protein